MAPTTLPQLKNTRILRPGDKPGFLLVEEAVQRVKVGMIRPRLCDYESAARYLGIAPKTLRNMISAGKLPFRPIHINSKPLFRLDDLDEYIEGLE
jgi:excisionase family DNA binding protein